MQMRGQGCGGHCWCSCAAAEPEEPEVHLTEDFQQKQNTFFILLNLIFSSGCFGVFLPSMKTHSLL